MSAPIDVLDVMEKQAKASEEEGCYGDACIVREAKGAMAELIAAAEPIMEFADRGYVPCAAFARLRAALAKVQP